MGGVALGLIGCSASPPPAPFVLLLPGVTVVESLTPGSSLGPPADAAEPQPVDEPAEEPADRPAVEPPEGPQDQPVEEPAEEDATAAIAVRCRLLYLSTPRTGGLRSLGLGAAIVADVDGSVPVLETPDLTLSALYTDGPGAVQWLKELDRAESTEVLTIADRTTFIPVGARFQLSMGALERVEDPRDWLDEFENRGPIPKEAGVIVTNAGAETEVALVVTDLDPAREKQNLEDYLADPNVLAAPPGPMQDELVRQEVLKVNRAPAVGAPLVLHLDSPFTGGNGTSVAFVIEAVLPFEAVGTNEQEAATQLAATALALQERREPLTEESRQQIERVEALSVFQRRGGRSALLQVAQEAGAPLALDLALVADDEFLTTLSRRAFPMEAGDVSDENADSAAMPGIGWRLDSAAWNLLAEGALNEELDSELEGVFYRAAGALAAFPDLIQEAAVAAGGSAALFHERLMVEQRYFLEDSSPSSRLRAYDWLKERGEVIPGYDPLGDRDARRAALEAAAEKTQEENQ